MAFKLSKNELGRRGNRKEEKGSTDETLSLLGNRNIIFQSSLAISGAVYAALKSRCFLEWHWNKDIAE